MQVPDLRRCSNKMLISLPQNRIKRRSAFTHHLQEKHQSVGLEVAQIDACNPKLRDGSGYRVRRNPANAGRTGRRSSRTKAPSPSPVFFRQTIDPTNVDLPSTLAIPAIPDSICKSFVH